MKIYSKSWGGKTRPERQEIPAGVTKSRRLNQIFHTFKTQPSWKEKNDYWVTASIFYTTAQH